MDRGELWGDVEVKLLLRALWEEAAGSRSYMSGVTARIVPWGPEMVVR
jgi:hypothetical protein